MAQGKAAIVTHVAIAPIMTKLMVQSYEKMGFGGGSHRVISPSGTVVGGAKARQTSEPKSMAYTTPSKS